jgi:UDPglucose--hexose-1-phosphate uridylyltransferase
MPDLRRDPIVGRWVIISTERSGRPHDFAQMQEIRPLSTTVCPFCPGQERLTPKEIMAYRAQSSEANAPNWTVRVIPNKFPALHVEGDLGREGVGLYDRMNGIGAHEVIIETPGHKDSMGELPAKKIEDVLWAYRDRIIDLKKDLRFRYILIFKNHGAAAGATLEHSHSQLIALPVIPTSVTEEIEGCRTHYQQKERCIYCDILRQDLTEGIRVVSENPEFV